MSKVLLLGLGFLCVGLGAVGTVVPLMPTTPFLLLAVWCFVRSDVRYREWVLGNRVLGPYVRGYFSGTGLSRQAKVRTLVLMWTMMTVSAVCFTSLWWVRALLAVVGAGVTVHIVRHGRRNSS